MHNARIKCAYIPCSYDDVRVLKLKNPRLWMGMHAHMESGLTCMPGEVICQSFLRMSFPFCLCLAHCQIHSTVVCIVHISSSELVCNGLFIATKLGDVLVSIFCFILCNQNGLMRTYTHE